MAVAQGIYRRGDSPRLYERARIDGKRTWRALESATVREAKAEVAKRQSEQLKSEREGTPSPYNSEKTIAAILDHYERAGFPDKKLRARTGKALAAEKRWTGHLRRLIGATPIERLALTICDTYALRRRPEIETRGQPGSRTLDLELQALANALRFALRGGLISTNPLRNDRPRYHSQTEARNARDVMPASGDELHLLAGSIAENPRGEVSGWLCIIQALSGCRISELVPLRRDAAPRTPGHLDGDWLWIKRRKRGVNPFVLLHADLRECLVAYQAWLDKNFPGSPFWFPSPNKDGSPIELSCLTNALGRVAAALGLPHRTSHGLRAYFVTVRRGQGASDAQVAAEIGDQTVALISQVYGQVPPGWRGGADLAWRPTTAVPYWKR